MNQIIEAMARAHWNWRQTQQNFPILSFDELSLLSRLKLAGAMLAAIRAAMECEPTPEMARAFCAACTSYYGCDNCSAQATQSWRALLGALVEDEK